MTSPAGPPPGPDASAGFDPAALPAAALVLLVGPSGAGKTTWATRTFPADEVLSSDVFRALVSGDPGDQAASADAFGVLHAVLRARTRRGLRSVVDATNLSAAARRGLLRIAARSARPTVAVVFDISLERCLVWNAARPGRRVPDAIVRRQHERLGEAMRAMREERFSLTRVLTELDLAQR